MSALGRFRGRWAVVAVIAASVTGCWAHQPVRALNPSISIRAELTRPREVPGVQGPVRRVEGFVQSVTPESIWVAPTSATTVQGGVVRLIESPTVSLPRDSTVHLTSSQPSARRTGWLIAGLVGVGVMLFVAWNAAMDDALDGIGY